MGVPPFASVYTSKCLVQGGSEKIAWGNTEKGPLHVHLMKKREQTEKFIVFGSYVIKPKTYVVLTVILLQSCKNAHNLPKTKH